MLSALFVLAGFLCASRVNSLAGLYLSYGVLVGLGAGFAYNSVISAVVKWFPDRVGLASGILLMGFGFGGLLLGTLSTSLITAYGWRFTFRGIGIAFAFLIALAAFILKLPPQEAAAGTGKTAETGFTARQMLREKSFWLFFFWTTLLTAAGLALIGHALPFALESGASSGTAALLVGVISISNGAGRVLSGALFDKWGGRPTMFLLGGGFILAGFILAAALKLSSVPLLIPGCLLAGLSFGGIVPCNSAVIAKLFGRANYPINFSIVNMCILISSFIGPLFAGMLKTSTGSYLPAFFMVSAYGTAATAANMLLREPQQPA